MTDDDISHIDFCPRCGYEQPCSQMHARRRTPGIEGGGVRQRKRKSIIGLRFGRLVVLSESGKTDRASHRYSNCACDCGSSIIVRNDSLPVGNTRSCGCISGDRARKTGTLTPGYKCWQSMIARCSNPNEPGYRKYGARGITVCERWRRSFSDFIADVGPRPSPRHSLDRYPDNAGNYEPGNVRWATPTEQGRNTKANRLITFRGETRCLSEWAQMFGVKRITVLGRIGRGWAVEDALTLQASTHEALRANPNNRRFRRITIQGETLCVADWAKRLGMSYNTLLQRVKLGWTEDELLTPIDKGCWSKARQVEAANETTTT